jgi:hypothetical protein
MNITVEDCRWFVSQCGVRATKDDLWGSPRTGAIRYHFNYHHMWVDISTRWRSVLLKKDSVEVHRQLVVTFDDLIMEASWVYQQLAWSWSLSQFQERAHVQTRLTFNVDWVGDPMLFHMVLAQWKMEAGC